MKRAVILLLALSCTKVLAQEFPRTPLGQLAEQMIQAINSGDAEKQSAFVRDNFSTESLKGGPAMWLQGFTYLHEQAGGVTLARVLTSPDPAGISLLLRSRRGDNWVQMQARLSESEPGKIDGIGLGPGENPLVTSKFLWPRPSRDEAANIREISRQVDHAASAGQFSGVVLIANKQRVLLTKACGMADRTFNVANDAATRFNIGSLNKMFTAVAIAQLVQAGKLAFSDRLSQVLPDYPNQAVAQQITIAQLLSHTAGMGDYFKEDFYAHKLSYKSLADYLPLFAGDVLAFAPGTQWSYSNAGYIVLGLVIERLSGEDYFSYVRRHVFEPAGMKRTDSYERDAVVDDLAVGYMRPEGFDPMRMQPKRMNWEYLPFKGSSAGGGYSSAGDLFRFTVALQNHVLLDAGLTEMLLDGKVATGRAPNVRYGFGFFDTTTENMRIAGHGGGAEGLNADVKIFRDGSYTIVVLSNYDAPAAAGLSQQIATFLGHAFRAG